MKSSILKATLNWNILFNKIRQLSTENVMVKPHIPLIKFRKGGNSKLNNSTSSSSQIKSTSIKSSGLDESMTPIKYKRKELTNLEIEAIEQGGYY